MLARLRKGMETLLMVLLVLGSLVLCGLTSAQRAFGDELRLPQLPESIERRRPRPRPAPTPSPTPSPSPSPDSKAQPAMPSPERANPSFELMQLEPQQRQWFYNFTNPGSCVQCSIAMCGVHCNDLRASTLLWDTEYGEHVWHGSWPQRVAQYCDERGIQAWNVTGETTWDWMKWAAKTGRFAAIGAGTAHFQTLYGYDPKTETWFVCNNQTPQKVDQYTDAQFRRLHLASGQWCVVLRRSSSAPPQIVEWWK